MEEPGASLATTIGSYFVDFENLDISKLDSCDRKPSERSLLINGSCEPSPAGPLLGRKRSSSLIIVTRIGGANVKPLKEASYCEYYVVDHEIGAAESRDRYDIYR